MAMPPQCNPGTRDMNMIKALAEMFVYLTKLLGLPYRFILKGQKTHLDFCRDPTWYIYSCLVTIMIPQ